jgi:hypothetical protein
MSSDLAWAKSSVPGKKVEVLAERCPVGEVYSFADIELFCLKL